MTWGERLALAHRTGRFSIDDKNAASSFQTCVVGESHPHRLLNELSMDELVAGKDFYMAVRDDNLDSAQAIYNAVQEANA